jgi:hypothetical protein
MSPKTINNVEYKISILFEFYLRNKCAAPMVVSPENHPIPTFVPLSGIVPYPDSKMVVIICCWILTGKSAILNQYFPSQEPRVVE